MGSELQSEIFVRYRAGQVILPLRPSQGCLDCYAFFLVPLGIELGLSHRLRFGFSLWSLLCHTASLSQ